MYKTEGYNVIDLSEYGEMFKLDATEFTALITKLITDGYDIYSLVNGDTDLDNNVVGCNVPLDIIKNLPRKTQRIKTQFMGNIGYLNTDIVAERKMYSQFYYSNGVVINASLVVEDGECYLNVALIRYSE